MDSYEKIGWIDHIIDGASGEVIQEGTPVSQKNMNHMDNGIFVNRQLLIEHARLIADVQREIKALRDATINNVVGNVVTVTFASVDSVSIVSGIFDQILHRIYV